MLIVWDRSKPEISRAFANSFFGWGVIERKSGKEEVDSDECSVVWQEEEAKMNKIFASPPRVTCFPNEKYI